MGNLFGKSYTIRHSPMGNDVDDDQEEFQPKLTMANQSKLKEKAKAADDAENRRLNQDGMTKNSGGKGKGSGDGSTDEDLIVEREHSTVLATSS